jgi:hypothetical protein
MTLVQIEVAMRRLENSGTVKVAQQCIAVRANDTAEAKDAPLATGTVVVIVINVGSLQEHVADFTVRCVHHSLKLFLGEAPRTVKTKLGGVALAVVRHTLSALFIAGCQSAGSHRQNFISLSCSVTQTGTQVYVYI